ncbi:MAG TPA: hypothetical protein VI197_30175 [Polyangiaceae bacterium]
MRKLTESDVTFTVRIVQEDEPVRGNAMASGDADLDRQVEDEILACLDRGDVEAWCSITVEARWHGYVGRDHLGCCSHLPGEGRPSLAKQVEDTIEWHGMRAEALADLNATLEATATDIASLG